MRKKSTRFLSAALAACMMVSALPVGAFAAAPAAASTESAVSTQAEEDAVAIDATNFPDGAFRQYVADNFDKDKDGALNQTERNAVKEIEISNSGCTSLQGLKYFSKLTDLFCSDNNLTELDVSENPELGRLICYNNSLTSLNLNKNTKLRSLNCNNNKLTVLDLRENKSLSWLRCKNNCLTSLDLRNNPQIGDLQVGSQRYQILANDDRTYDLHQLPGKFELDGVTTGSWKGGTVDPATWILKANSTTVTYNYEVEDDGFNFPVTLDVHWHNYQWKHDGTEHWKVCTTANCPGMTDEQRAEGPHTFASAKDAACADGCGYTRPLYTVTVKNATAILGGEELKADESGLSESEKNLRAIPGFNRDKFLNGAKKAFEIIVTSFAKGDVDTLENLVGKTLLKKFKDIIARRKEEGISAETDFIGFNEAIITDAKITKSNLAKISVKFVSEQVNILRDKNGEVLEGDENFIQSITDVWTFERGLNATTPNWLLVSTKK